MKGRHYEATSVEESRALLAALNGNSQTPKRQPDYSAPVATAVDVINKRTVSFDGDRVPPNLSNAHLPNIRPRWRGPSRWSVTEDWREWAITWGGAAREAAGWQKADPGQRARVTVVFYRVRQMDEMDGLPGSAKAIVDGLTRIIKHRPPRSWQSGAGLIWDDDPKHLPKALCEVRQERVHSFHEQRTVVTVERLP